MGFNCGIVGLPNVGKSTIFNALTSGKAASANFPFCTIEPNTGTVAVPDPRLRELNRIVNSEKLVPTHMTFVDIAGLIRGASKGEGLGNQFLGHIRSVDAIAHVVRCFQDNDIIHVDSTIDPLRDIDTIMTELIISDFEATEKQIAKFERVAKSGDLKVKAQHDALQFLLNHLAKGLAATTIKDTELLESLSSFFPTLVSGKPMMFIANVDEDTLISKDKFSINTPLGILKKFVDDNNNQLVVISGKIEEECAELSLEERSEFLMELGQTESGLDRMTLAGYRLLDLLTFFTAGPKEIRAWTALNGSTAPQCAGKIHSDFERGFIRAEVISYEDYLKYGGEVKAREAGKLRVEGKQYLVKDGDIVHFRFNV
jgi:ribosome-binding ATPase